MNGLVSFALGLGGDGLVMVLVAASLAFAILATHTAFASKGNLRARLAALAQRRPASGRSPRSNMTSNATFDATFDVLKRLVEHFKLARGDEAQKTQSLLAQAGWRTREALVVFMGIRLVLPIGATVLALAAMAALQDSGFKLLFGGVVAASAGTYLPKLVLNHIVKGRQTRFRKALPDALDLLVVCAEAGLGLDGAINRVAREFHRFQTEVAEELALTGIELGFLPNRHDALKNMAKRINIPSVNSLMYTLIQTERYGTPLSQSLKTIATDLREERMLIAEERAAKLPAVMTVPMILFILPAVFIVLIGPAVIQIMQNFSH